MSAQLATQPKVQSAELATYLSDEVKRRAMILEYVGTQMTKGVDYGIIPGTGKKDANGIEVGKRALLKPGAEKLVGLFSCYADPEIVSRIENWDTGLFHFEVRVRVRRMEDDKVLAHGVGSANSWESRYRYRKGERLCPKCGAAAIIRSKFPPREDPQAEPGWYCFDKRGGCGHNFPFASPDIAEQVVGNIPNPDIHSTHNTVLKQAKKRALVDAALTFIRGSDLFEQGEDNYPGSHQNPEKWDDPVRPQQQQKSGGAVQAPDFKEFQAEVNRVRTDWKNVIEWINADFRTKYPIDTAFSKIAPEHLAAAFAAMKTVPTPKRASPAPAAKQASQPESTTAPAGESKEHMLAKLVMEGEKFFAAGFGNWLDQNFNIPADSYMDTLKASPAAVLKDIQALLDCEKEQGDIPN